MEQEFEMKPSKEQEVVGHCAFEYCKTKDIQRQHKAISVDGKDFHVNCYALIQRQKDSERSQDGLTRKERRKLGRLEKGRTA